MIQMFFIDAIRRSESGAIAASDFKCEDGFKTPCLIFATATLLATGRNNGYVSRPTQPHLISEPLSAILSRARFVKPQTKCGTNSECLSANQISPGLHLSSQLGARLDDQLARIPTPVVHQSTTHQSSPAPPPHVAPLRSVTLQ